MNQVKKAYVFFAPGFEEIEAITPVDILKRGGVKVSMISITDELKVKGAHNIEIICDSLIEDMDENILPDAIIMPGGIPGATNLANCKKLEEFAKKCFNEKKLVCAICASPAIVFGTFGLLKNKNWTCYPDMENNAPEADVQNWNTNPVVVDTNLITSRGPGTTAAFSYTILQELDLSEKSAALQKGMLFI